MGFQAVSVNYWAVMPILIVFGGALLGVLVEAFAARSVRHSIQLSISVVALVAAQPAEVDPGRVEVQQAAELAGGDQLGRPGQDRGRAFGWVGSSRRWWCW